MKLEKILERINSLEKGQFLKVINNLSASEKDNPKLEAVLSSSDSNLKNADAVQVAQAFEALSDSFIAFIMDEYAKASSQLDILLFHVVISSRPPVYVKNCAYLCAR